VKTDHQALIDKVVHWLESDNRIEALWLAGSLATGKADEWSDVDFLAYCAEGTVQAVAADIPKGAEAICPPLLISKLFGGSVISIVGEGWVRYDFSLISSAQLPMYDARFLKPLFNKTDVEPAGHYPDSHTPQPATLLRITNDFLRILGLAPTVAGRGEFVVLMSGVEQLRGLTIELMLEENGIGPWARGGHLARKAQLTEEQYSALEALPALSADRESTLANHVALAGIFLPRAKALFAKTGAEWPERFETETREHLKTALGLDI
jgi:hypothetical protein